MNLFIGILCPVLVFAFEKLRISRYITFYVVSVLLLSLLNIPWTFFVIIASIGLLILLITLFKIHAFLAFLIISIMAGMLLGLNLKEITPHVQKGIGDMLGGLVIVVACGAMLGKLTADSGAAQRIASGLMNLFGPKYIQWALVITGFIIGIPLFYNVGFVLVIPLIFSVAYKYKMPLVYIALPMLAALSVTHGFLPPHPAPTALVSQFGADMGTTLFYGIIISIPTVAIAGPFFARTLKHINPPIPDTFVADSKPEAQLPGLANSIFSSLLPVILLTITTIGNTVIKEEGMLKDFLVFISDSQIVMIVSLLVATITLGLGMRFSMMKIMNIYGEAIKDIAMLLLIIGGAGSLKQILVATGVSEEIGSLLEGVDIHPLILGWMIAALIRVCVGSATVAGLTAASIVLPLLKNPGIDPNLMVLSVGAGSLLFSHVNDSGFWMFKEYLNLSIKETMMSWSIMETIVSILGLAGVMTMHYILMA